MDVALFDVVTAVKHTWTLRDCFAKLDVDCPLVNKLVNEVGEKPGIQRRLVERGGPDVMQCMVDGLVGSSKKEPKEGTDSTTGVAPSQQADSEAGK